MGISRATVVVVVTLVCTAFAVLWRFYSGSARRPTVEGRSGSKKLKPKKAEADDDQHLPQFLLLLGIPGSGKSTWAKEFVFRCDASFSIVSSDEIRRQITGSINDQTKNSEVWDVVLNQCQGHLSAGRNVILDATNTHTDKRRSFVKQLPKCRRYLKMFAISKHIAKVRVSRDVENGVDRANVPDQVIDVMYRQFQDSVSAVKDEGWRIK